MRRFVTTAVAVALMGGAALAGPAVAADDTTTDRLTGPAPPAPSRRTTCSPPSPAGADRPGKQTAPQALDTARRVLGGRALPRDPSVTMALRDLWRTKSELRGSEPRARDRPARPAHRRRLRPPGRRLHRPGGRTGLQHPAVPPLRDRRPRRAAVARVARAEPRGHGLGVEPPSSTSSATARRSRTARAAAAPSSTSTSRTSAAASTATARRRSVRRSARPRATACSTTTSRSRSSPTRRRSRTCW